MSSEESEPVFLMSWVRSGSTLLRFILDTHPELACPAEIELGTLCEALIYTLSATVGLIAAGPLAMQNVVGEVRRIVDGIMGRYLRDKRKRVWCDKSPSNVMSSATLEAVYPDARFICLYRDGVDVVHSCAEYVRRERLEELDPFLARAGGEVLDAATEAWTEATRRMLELEQRRPEACYRVRYEDLVREPEKVLPPLFAWLGLAWDPQLLSAAFAAEHDPGDGDAKVRFTQRVEAGSVGRGRKHGLGGVDAARLDAMTQVLSHLGYAPPSQRGEDVAAPRGPELDATTFFRQVLPRRLRERGHELRGAGTYKFVITGAAPAVWFLDASGSKPYLAPVDREAACTVRLDGAVLAAIVSGRENPVTAYLDGRLTLEGDVASARALRSIV